ncbi:Carbon-monoxide dehydrogenase, molybdopterin binding, large subunit [Modestobacter italicus]|uniref:Carbon-monoxide dehydrogenase, molybdopterin binding, large subunit n=1 Tax=Modestobacter italicus (strain DSM 44449 / CECT 9708 / BC 501) TaxID=2732864 RepID=I4F486_MODI5|nr:xanthine dehydrogenase family protein molybdopterin-binding subunit [Modestobacter marinus]CCH90449.1 Carbon-monoxide dehydrogenase, molybdopterin binding, large subunit [Modestobacter marinus]
MSILGTRVVRTEDPLFLTRGAVYTDDLVDERLTGALHATFVRSQVAHGRLLSVDTSAALEAPGVVAVVTAADVTDLVAIPPPFPFINEAMTRPWLASDRVRFVGDPIAVVLTEERYQGEDAAELVVVDIDPLPAVVGTAAAAADEVLLFPEAGTNVMASFGEPATADFFDGCEVVVTQALVNQRVAPVPLEGRAAAAAWSADGRLTAWCTNQGAQQARGQFGDWLEMDPDLIHLITPDVGGGFGAKIGADPEYAFVAWLAKHVGRPVRWAESRSENMIGMLHGRAQDQVVTIGGRRDGTVEAYSLVFDQDCGAYPRLGAVLPTLTMLMAPGVYAFPKVHAQGRALATTTTSIGAYRGAGRPEATAAVERAIDLFAAEIGMDPAEVRRKNLLPAFSEPHTTPMGATYDNGDYTTALDKALEAAGYDELRAEQARRREAGEVRQLGIGLSVYVEITGADNGAGTKEAASLEVHADGTATVLTGTSPHGQGHATAWAMIASDQLGIPVEKITVLHGDTDLVPQGGGTMGSRSLQQGGAAVHQAAEELIEEARRRAAERLEVDPADLVVDLGLAGLAVRGTPGAVVTFAELAGDERLLVATMFEANAPTFPFGAHVAVVEMDVESGKAQLTRLVAVDDAGTVINPLIAEGQRHGGFAQGVAQALLEEVLYDEDGNPTTSTLADYPFVSATELPSFELVDMATPTPMNPLGAKGIGEAGTIGSTPAVQNAVIDAVAHLGVRHVDMPVTPMRVWRAVQQAAHPEQQEGN